jgi:glutathione S-transferase
MAPFVVKVVRALRLKKLPFQLVEPAGPEDYRRWNPETGLLPLIDVDGTRVHDSPRILDLLDERFPEPPLQSSDPVAAAAQRRLEAWVGETFFFYWTNYLRSRVEEEEGASERRGSAGGGVGVGRKILARFGILRGESGDGAGGGLGPEFERRMDDLVNFLGGRSYFHGDRLNRADLAVYSFLVPMRSGVVPGGHRFLAARPVLVEHMERVEQETGGAD